MLTVNQVVNGIKIDYLQGIKTSTIVIIEPNDACKESFSRLTIIDIYDATSESVSKQQLHTVDKSIKIWAEHIQRYLYAWKRWSHIILWRWYMKNIWQPMKPSGRRITYILLWVVGLETALILLGIIIYYLENS